MSSHNAGALVLRASVSGTLVALCVCSVFGISFADYDDPAFGTKLAIAGMNALLMAIVFECAFMSGLAAHNLQHSSIVRIVLHYIVIELAYWSYHALQHASPFVWNLTDHAMHHSVHAAKLVPMDAWYISATDFLGWSACAVLPNMLPVTRLHGVQHRTLLTVLAVALMLQHSPVWAACTDTGCVGHVVHHAPSRTLHGLPPLFGTGVSSLLLGV